jgi:hypothetical protein
MTRCAKEMLNNMANNKQVQIPIGLDELANSLYDIRNVWSSVG